MAWLVSSIEGHLWAAGAWAAAPALRLMLRRRVLRGKEIAERLPERFGQEALARPVGRLLWLHAASVGETLSVLPLLPLLPQDLIVLFTTGTVTSARLLASRLDPALRDRVLHRFVPLDVPAWARSFLDHWRPDAAVFVESELWPNLLAGCRARRIPAGLVNARLSARSARRWRLADGLVRGMLGSFTWIAAQSEADAGRLRSLGGRTVTAAGDLKLAADPLPFEPAELARLKALIENRPVWAAVSTHPGEEALVAEVHAMLIERFPALLTIVVPRHPQRGEAVASLLGNAPRRSAAADPGAGGFWVCDTLGETGLVYRLAQTVFVGKSFGGGGGQNPWEPARLGCAIAVGPATANFEEAVQILSSAGGLVVVSDRTALAAWVATMLEHADRRGAQGAAAQAAVTLAAAKPGPVAGMIAALLP